MLSLNDSIVPVGLEINLIFALHYKFYILISLSGFLVRNGTGKLFFGRICSFGGKDGSTSFNSRSSFYGAKNKT